jgi:hypothetical protein
MAPHVDRDPRGGQLETRHGMPGTQPSAGPMADPWRVERLELRHVKGPVRGVREREQFSRRDWVLYVMVVVLTVAAAAAVAFSLS